MKNIFVILLLYSCLSPATESFGNNRKADRYFDHYAYSAAIPLYKKTALLGSAKDKPHATFRLADCYRLTGDFREARSWYSRGISMFKPEPIDYFHLGQVQRTLGNYPDAEKAFEIYAKLNPGDPRGAVYAGYCRGVDSFLISTSVEIRQAALLNTKNSEFGPVFYKGGIIFASDRKKVFRDERIYEWTNRGYLDLYYSEPRFFRDFWDEMTRPEKLPLLNQTWHDGPVCFSQDFTRIFVTRTLETKGKGLKDQLPASHLQIFHAIIKPGKKVIYNPFPLNSKNYSVGHPSVSEDGKKLVFSSDMPGGSGGSDLYMTEMKGGRWSNPKSLGPGINSFGDEVFPYLANDSTLYFSSDGLPGLGGLDLYESHLKNGVWQKPVNLQAPVNSSYDDFGIVFQKGKMDGFFSSDRPGGMGMDDIYAFRNYSREPVPGKQVISTVPDKQSLLMASGIVRDKQTLLPLDSATIFVANARTGDVTIAMSDSQGIYTVQVEDGTLYAAKAMKKGYFYDCSTFRFNLTGSSSPLQIPTDLLPEKYQLNQIFPLKNIYYNTDQWVVRDDAEETLDRLAALMKEYPIHIELSSHTDSRAPADYNKILSQKRAEAVVRYLILKGIHPARMVAMGYGESRLINRCADGVKCSESEHQVNRRTEFKVTAMDSRFSGRNQLDLTLFRIGEKMPVNLLGPGFFRGCLKEVPFILDLPSQPVAVAGNSFLEKAAVSPETGKESSSFGSDAGTIQAPGPDSSGSSEKNAKDLFSTFPNDITTYSVQVKASITPFQRNSRMFSGEKEVFEKRIGIYYKYYIGQFDNLSDAVSAKERLRSRFPGSFLAAFKNGKSVPVNELQIVLK